jgi:hypothetical protein
VNLRRFWFRFESLPPYNALGPGCGVTAYTYDDAIAILRAAVFKNEEVPPIRDVIEDVDVSSLDQGHVIPNIDPPVWRGVWFPKGYVLPS